MQVLIILPNAYMFSGVFRIWQRGAWRACRARFSCKYVQQ